jgi:hypothetical protein
MPANAQIQPEDQPLDRLTKSIPAEFASTFLALNSFLSSGDVDPGKQNILMGSFIFLLVLLPFYLWKVRGIKIVSQHVASWLALFIWAININPNIFGIIPLYSSYSSAVGGALVILWAVISPIITVQKSV